MKKWFSRAFLALALLMPSLCLSADIERSLNIYGSDSEATYSPYHQNRFGNFSLTVPLGWIALSPTEMEAAGIKLDPAIDSAFRTSDRQKNIFFFVSENNYPFSSKMASFADESLKDQYLASFVESFQKNGYTITSAKVADFPAIQGAWITTSDGAIFFESLHNSRYYAIAATTDESALANFLQTLRWDNPTYTKNNYRHSSRTFKIGLPPEWKLTKRERTDTSAKLTIADSTIPGSVFEIAVFINPTEESNFTDLSAEEQRKEFAAFLQEAQQNMEMNFSSTSIRQSGNTLGIYMQADAPSVVGYSTVHNGKAVNIFMKLNDNPPESFGETPLRYMLHQISYFNHCLDSLEIY